MDVICEIRLRRTYGNLVGLNPSENMKVSWDDNSKLHGKQVQTTSQI